MTRHLRIFAETLLCLVSVTFATNWKCPDSSQWQLRAKGFCMASNPWYYCLFDENRSTYRELCAGKQAFHKPGYKYIISGNINGKSCEKNRFQPFKFGTNGNSECIFKKTTCNGEGQVIYGNGSSTTDISCRCDYTNGFAFVQKPRNACYCNQYEEDCSCFKKLCYEKEILTPDYDCLSVVLAVGDFRCPRSNVIRLDYSFQSRATHRATEIGSSGRKKNVIHQALHKARTVVLTSLIVLFVALVFYLLFAKSYEKILRSEIETRVKERLTQELTRVNENTSKFSKTTRDVFKEHIVDWEKEDVKFITTTGTMEIEHRLKTDNCVLVIGISGNGKSSILRHLALKLRAEDNYDIIPIVLGPGNILTFRNERQNQDADITMTYVFYISCIPPTYFTDKGIQIT